MKTKRLIILVLTALLCFSSLLCGCKKEEAEFTVTVKSEGSLPLSDIPFAVYESGEGLVWAGDTDDAGNITFTGIKGRVYEVLLKEVPLGYICDDGYLITETETDIILSTSLIPLDSVSTHTFSLGDVFFDFEITDTAGKVHKLSELLEEKKAVVLNFWFINCGPCKMEFPYLEEAYTEYSDALEVIAVNPVDGTDETISAFAKDLSLTFPMAKGDPNWEKALGISGYPTTVVIDRYGTVGFIHRGSITEKDEFTKVFEFFTSDDYTQTTVRNLSDIK